MSGSPSRSVFHRHPVATLTTFVVFASLILDMGLAAAYRLVTGQVFNMRDAEGGGRKAPPFRVASPVFHHGLKALATADDVEWGPRRFHFYTDSLGFRNASPVEVPLNSVRHRLLFIGDSFTEGIGVEYEDTLTGRIAQALAADGTEVLNAAVISYSPIIYWRKTKYLLENVGLRFDRLIVFLDVSDVFDEAIRYDLSPDGFVVDQDPAGRANRLSLFLRRTTVLTYFVLNAVHDFLFERPSERVAKNERFRERYGINRERTLWTIDPASFNRYGRVGLERARGYMDALATLLADRGIGLTVAVYPSPDQIFNGDVDSLHARTWRDWARDRGVRFVDYFPCFLAEGQTLDDRKRLLDELFIPGDVHWNERGHEVIARIFLMHFLDEIPDDRLRNMCHDLVAEAARGAPADADDEAGSRGQTSGSYRGNGTISASRDYSQVDITARHYLEPHSGN
jgi:hypothetical protein